MQSQAMFKLMLVTNRQNTAVDDYLDFIKRCAEAGISSVQLREKQQSLDFLLMFGQKIKAILDPLQIPLIVNDSLELALKLEASGLHLGQTDGDPAEARKILGPKKYLGVSIDSHDDLIKANALELDYVGVGAIYPSQTKQNVKTLWGLEGLQELATQSKYPIVGIGGINEYNAAAVLRSGASGLAVIAALHEAQHPGETAARLRHIVDNRGKQHD